MTEKAKRRRRDQGFSRLEALYEGFVGELEACAADRQCFYRRLVARGRDAAPEEIVTSGADLERMKTFVLILEETEKLRRSLYALPNWEAREKIAVEQAKLKLMEKKLEGGEAPAAGVVILPAALPEEDIGEAAEV